MPPDVIIPVPERDKMRQRIHSLFAEIELLAVQPASDVDVVRREIETLRLRVVELETQFYELKKVENLAAREEETRPRAESGTISLAEPQPVQSRPAAPLLYEKEQVGYAFSDERVQLLQPSNLEPARGENVIHAMLMETGQPIGAVVVEPQPERLWTPDDEELADAVARQVSLQIQNLRLLEAAERARAEAQAATQRFTHEGWESFLDSIHQDERIGYVYDQNSVTPLVGAPAGDIDFQETVKVLDEQVGRLYLKADPHRPLTEDDKLLVTAVASRMGQQVENLRLLADASRARAEAEEATRRLTREGWQAYAEQQTARFAGQIAHGFVYDTNRVSPLLETQQDVSYSEPLMVRGESIGQLAVAGLEQISPEIRGLLAAVAAQTSLHLETLRLTEELQKRAAELEELDRLKSSFLANMSHELRTPLNSILGFSDVILEGIDGPLTDYMENDLRLIQKNGQHLLHMINDVLDMAKIESGRMNLHPEAVKVHSILEEVLGITSTLANNKNLAFFIEPDSDPEVEIYADVTRIRQIMINLVNNSIKFTEKGHVCMRVDRVTSDKVEIIVRDTGIGIPIEHLQMVFDEFAQVDTSTTRKVGGTGLGLPISRRLAEMHGGRMWVESTGISGQGSAFHVQLPLVAIFAEPVEKVTR